MFRLNRCAREEQPSFPIGSWWYSHQIDHESIIVVCPQNIHRFVNDYKDAGTSDFITQLMESHEKMAWFLRSHLK